MGVKKYRSVEEMPGPEARPPLDPDNLRIAFAWIKLASELRPGRLRPGVRKYRSLDRRPGGD
jgi:hypothetical protein